MIKIAACNDKFPISDLVEIILYRDKFRSKFTIKG